MKEYSDDQPRDPNGEFAGGNATPHAGEVKQGRVVSDKFHNQGQPRGERDSEDAGDRYKAAPRPQNAPSKFADRNDPKAVKAQADKEQKIVNDLKAQHLKDKGFEATHPTTLSNISKAASLAIRNGTEPRKPW